MSTSPVPRRLVRTVVCSYSRDELPVSWLRVFHRLEREIAKAGLRVRVQLAPLEELPETFEVLVVHPSLLERARKIAPEARILGTTREAANVAVDELMEELRSGERLYAERVTPGEPRIMVHRGPNVL